MNENRTKVSATANVANLAQSLRFVLEKEDKAELSAIGEPANAKLIKAIASVRKMLGIPLYTDVQWVIVGEGTENERTLLYYTVYKKVPQ